MQVGEISIWELNERKPGEFHHYYYSITNSPLVA